MSTIQMILGLLVAAHLQGCGLWVGNPKPKETPTSSALDLPLVTPPVKAATPVALSGETTPALTLLALPGGEFKGRFFSAGPTDIFDILATIDAGIEGFNTRAAGAEIACLAQEPVPYTVAPFGQEMTFHAQCHEVMTGASDEDPKLVQFGQKDGSTYLYFAVAQQRAAVIVTPSPDAAGAYVVQAWLGVGYLNATGCGAFDKCSYGVIQLQADSSRQAFEMAVAGIGFGYCGAQLKSDGSSIFAEGSVDGPDSCVAPDTLCVAASDLSTAADCTAFEDFELPALGRDAASGSREYGASAYPNVPNVVLDGTRTDSLNFGPVVPTDGVGAFR